MRTLHTIEAAVDWFRQRGVTALTTDSRQVQPGQGFIAWPGAAYDARAFVGQALNRGAAACLVELEGSEAYPLQDHGDAVAAMPQLKAASGALAADFLGNPSRSLRVVAITGTNGKTSTAWWLAQALSALPGQAAMPCGVVGTLGVGRPAALGRADGLGTVISTGLTTPDPVQLHNALATFVRDGLQACAMEASSIGVQEQRLQGTQVEMAVFTNFTQDHLDYHGSMEAYWAAKRRLFAWPGLRSAVVNIDDTQGAALANELAAQGALDVWTVSTSRAARLRASNLVHAPQGLRFDVVEGDVSVALQSRLIGAYNVSNVLGVLAAMRALGADLAQAVEVCTHLRPVPGRMECLGGDRAPLVAVDYAHTPDALEKALLALRPLAHERGGQLWCVFGCGGDRDSSKRPLMGAMAAKSADRVVLTSDNPRSEKPEAIIAQVLLGLSPCAAVEVQADRARAILETVMQAKDVDVILLAGKGHETTQEIAGVKLAFVDGVQAAAALQARRQAHQGVAA